MAKAEQVSLYRESWGEWIRRHPWRVALIINFFLGIVGFGIIFGLTLSGGMSTLHEAFYWIKTFTIGNWHLGHHLHKFLTLVETGPEIGMPLHATFNGFHIGWMSWLAGTAIIGLGRLFNRFYYHFYGKHQIQPVRIGNAVLHNFKNDSFDNSALATSAYEPDELFKQNFEAETRKWKRTPGIVRAYKGWVAPGGWISFLIELKSYISGVITGKTKKEVNAVVSEVQAYQANPVLAGDYYYNVSTQKKMGLRSQRRSKNMGQTLSFRNPSIQSDESDSMEHCNVTMAAYQTPGHSDLSLSQSVLSRGLSSIVLLTWTLVHHLTEILMAVKEMIVL